MEQQFCLRWNNHPTNLTGVLMNFLKEQTLCDVSLVCQGASFKAHKNILSACSPLFESIFIDHSYEQSLVIFLKDISSIEMDALLNFMYKGEVHIFQNQLPDFLKTAEALKIRGLTDSKLNTTEDSIDTSRQKHKLEPRSPPCEKRKRKSSNSCDTNRLNDTQAVQGNYKSTHIVPKANAVSPSDKDQHMEDIRTPSPNIKQEHRNGSPVIDSYHSMSEALQTGGSVSVHAEDVNLNTGHTMMEQSEIDGIPPTSLQQDLGDSIDVMEKSSAAPPPNYTMVTIYDGETQISSVYPDNGQTTDSNDDVTDESIIESFSNLKMPIVSNVVSLAQASKDGDNATEDILETVVISDDEDRFEIIRKRQRSEPCTLSELDDTTFNQKYRLLKAKTLLERQTIEVDVTEGIVESAFASTSTVVSNGYPLHMVKPIVQRTSKGYGTDEMEQNVLYSATSSMDKNGKSVPENSAIPGSSKSDSNVILGSSRFTNKGKKSIRRKLCPICNAIFADLEAHMLEHTVLPIVCSLCGMQFRSNRLLKGHAIKCLLRP